MCTGAEVIPLLIAAAGTGTQVVGQQDALRRQANEATRGIVAQAALQRQGQQRVNQNIQEIAASNPDAERAAANQDFVTALQKAGLTHGGVGLQTPVGATSGRFAEDVTGAQKAAGGENTALAGLLSRIDAPQFQRAKEGQAMANTASDLSLLGGQSAAQDFLTRLRSSQITPNPWVQGLGQGAAAFGQTLAGRARPGLPTNAPGTQPGMGLPIGGGGTAWLGGMGVPNG